MLDLKIVKYKVIILRNNVAIIRNKVAIVRFTDAVVRYKVSIVKYKVTVMRNVMNYTNYELCCNTYANALFSYSVLSISLVNLKKLIFKSSLEKACSKS